MITPLILHSFQADLPPDGGVGAGRAEQEVVVSVAAEVLILVDGDEGRTPLIRDGAYVIDF